MPSPSQPRAGHALRRAGKRVRVVLVLALYAALSPFGYAFVALRLKLHAGDELQRARRVQRLSGAAFRLMFRFLGLARLVHLRTRDALPGLPPAPFVLVANHPTLMDVAAITALVDGVCSVAKPSVFRQRLLRPFVQGAGHLEGPGADPVAAGRLVGRAVERLEQGFVFLIFPEGTRSPVGGSHRFGRAAFEIACRARVPVVSLGIRCEPVWLSKQVGFLDPPYPTPELSLSVLAIDDPARVEYDARRLLEAVEDRYAAWNARVSTRHTPVPPKEAPCPTPSKTDSRR